ncbi:MAG: phage portal protein [Desulfovibrio sp.]
MWPFNRSKQPEQAQAVTNTPVKRTRFGKGRNIGQKVVFRSGASSGYSEAATSSHLTAGWASSPLHPIQICERQFTTVLARSRETSFNSDHGKRFLHLVKNNVIGPNGVSVIPQVKGLNGRDELACKALDAAWKTWGKKGNCDVTGKYTWIQLQRLAVSTVARDGECFVRKLRGKAFGPHAFQLQLIDPTRIDVLFRQDLTNGNRVRCGIEFDEYDRVIAYYVRKDSDDIHGGYTYSSAKYHRIPADEMIHLFLPEMIDQPRGFGWMGTSLVRLHHLSSFETAAVINARVGAAKMGFITPDPEFIEVDPDDDEPDDLPMDAEPGVFEELPAGYAFTEFNPQYPQGEFDPFAKSILRSVATGLLVSYHSLTGDLSGANYSSLRQGALDERDVWENLQQWFIDFAIEDIHQTWVEQVVLVGAATIGKTPLRIGRVEDYKAAKYQGRRWPWVDPLKDSKASSNQVEKNQRSLSSVIREQGNDPDEVFEEIAEDNKKLLKLGIIKEEVKPEVGGNNG